MASILQPGQITHRKNCFVQIIEQTNDVVSCHEIKFENGKMITDTSKVITLNRNELY